LITFHTMEWDLAWGRRVIKKRKKRSQNKKKSAIKKTRVFIRRRISGAWVGTSTGKSTKGERGSGGGSKKGHCPTALRPDGTVKIEEGKDGVGHRTGECSVKRNARSHCLNKPKKKTTPRPPQTPPKKEGTGKETEKKNRDKGGKERKRLGS